MAKTVLVTLMFSLLLHVVCTVSGLPPANSLAVGKRLSGDIVGIVT